MPSSKCIGRKKITNNREKTGKKPGAQKGHPHPSRKPMKPDKIIGIQTEDELKDSSRYVPTGKIVSKPMLFLLNSRCNVSLEKTAQFVKDITDGALSPSVGMINGLCREFSLKSKSEQDSLCRSLLDAPVMHVDGTVARVNGSNNHVIVCSNGAATMYFARESKGHAAVKGTPVETFGGILIHDHDYPNLNKIQTFPILTGIKKVFRLERFGVYFV